MTKDRKIEPDKISIQTLQTIKGSIDSPSNLSFATGGEHNFEFELEHGVQVVEKVVGIILSVVIRAIWPNQPATQQVVASFTHELVFKVENLDDFVEVVDGAKPIVDRLMMGTLIGIAYSTVRGIIYTRTQGTALKGAILPVIDPKKFITEEMPAGTPGTITTNS
jgi:hypothetical protein